MQSNDLGCTYSGGANHASVLTNAGLSFFTHSEEQSMQSMTHQNIFIFSLNAICLDGADMDEDMKRLHLNKRSSFKCYLLKPRLQPSNSTPAVLTSPGLGCNSQSARHRRSVDLHQEMMALGKTAALDLQTCCIIELNVFFSI